MVFIQPSDAVLYGPISDGWIVNPFYVWVKVAEYTVPADVDEASYRVKFRIRSLWMYGWVDWLIRKNDTIDLASGSTTSFEYVQRSRDVGTFTAGDKLQFWVKHPCEFCGGYWTDFTVGGEEYIPPPPLPPPPAPPPPAPPGLCVVFGLIGDGFNFIGDQFILFGVDALDWWLFGETIHDILYDAALKCYEIEKWFDDAQLWCIEVTTKLKEILSFDSIIASLNSLFHFDELFSWFSTKWDDFVIMVTDIVAIVWDWLPTSWAEMETLIKNTVRSIWDWLPTTKVEFEEMVEGLIPPLPDWLPTSWNEFVTKMKAALPEIPTVNNIVDWVSEQFEKILDKVFEE